MQSDRMKMFLLILGIALVALAAIMVYSLVRPPAKRDCGPPSASSVDNVICENGR